MVHESCLSFFPYSFRSSQMTFLSEGPMSIVISFLDHPGLAKLAQTCKSAQAIVYRRSVWSEWLPRPGCDQYYCVPGGIPKTARHVGQPTKLCFYEWANYRRVIPDGTLARRIAFEPDPERHYTLLEAHWRHIGCPCVHLHHHAWADVFKGRAFLEGKTSAEIQRIYLRVTTQTGGGGANPYWEWLHARTQLIPWAAWPVLREPDALAPAAAEDPLLAISHSIATMEYERNVYLWNRKRETVEIWNRSMEALHRARGAAEFEANERAYKKDPWRFLSAIALSVPEVKDESTVIVESKEAGTEAQAQMHKVRA